MSGTPHCSIGSSSSREGTTYFARCSCGWSVTPATWDAAEKAHADHIHSHGLLTHAEELAARDVVRPFPNGTSHAIWRDENCDRCAKGYDEDARTWRCPLERAIDEGAIGDGTMDRELAVRAGLHGVLVRGCPEFRVREMPGGGR